MQPTLWGWAFLLIEIVLLCIAPLAGIGLLVYAGSKRKWKLLWGLAALLVMDCAAAAFLAFLWSRMMWQYG